MDYPIATVLTVSGHDALVRVEGVACPRCAAGKGCGAGIFAQSRASTTLTVGVADGLRVLAGERVTLSLADTSLVRAALCLYGAPLAGLLLASGLAFVLVEARTDAAMLLWSLAGLGIGVAAGAIQARRDPCINSLTATINGHARIAAEELSA